jgi:hypothetical protein
VVGSCATGVYSSGAMIEDGMRVWGFVWVREVTQSMVFAAGELLRLGKWVRGNPTPRAPYSRAGNWAGGIAGAPSMCLYIVPRNSRKTYYCCKVFAGQSPSSRPPLTVCVWSRRSLFTNGTAVGAPMSHSSCVTVASPDRDRPTGCSSAVRSMLLSYVAHVLAPTEHIRIPPPSVRNISVQ